MLPLGVGTMLPFMKPHATVVVVGLPAHCGDHAERMNAAACPPGGGPLGGESLERAALAILLLGAYSSRIDVIFSPPIR